MAFLNWLAKEQEKLQKRIDNRKRFFDRYDDRKLVDLWKNRDSLPAVDKKAIQDLLIERGVMERRE